MDSTETDIGIRVTLALVIAAFYYPYIVDWIKTPQNLSQDSSAAVLSVLMGFGIVILIWALAFVVTYIKNIFAKTQN
jgi:hypothetical protein